MTVFQRLRAWLRKGEAKQGQNHWPSQITERPAPPPPIRWLPPVPMIYDIEIEEYRAVTQEDVSRMTGLLSKTRAVP